MNQRRINELRALCEAATLGPWFEGDLGIYFDATAIGGIGNHNVMALKQNRPLIAAARTALPEALDEIERLRNEIDDLDMYITELETELER